MYDCPLQHAPFAYKFTGKERDSESGLDNFGARYNSSNLGRFMSPDPKQIGAHMFDPQTLNRYAYTRNNPLAFIDPDGRDLEKAWKDVKTFANSIYVKVSIGLGAELKAKRGPVEAKVGFSYKANAETSQDSILKVSKSADLGVSAGTENHTVYGKSGSVEQTVLTLQNDMHLTGEEPPIVTTGDKVGPANASEDKLGIGLEGGLVVVGGGEVGATREGLSALKDAASEVKDSLTNPGPPSAPKPPQPPACTADKDKKCN
jgi:RHS repeat-associated protein